MTNDTEPTLWWQASKDRVEGSNINKFRKVINATYGLDLTTYDDLHFFSVNRLEEFWATFWEWAGFRYHRKYTKVLSTPHGARPGDLPRFFDDALLNLAENVLFPLHPKNATACMPHAPREWPHSKSTVITEYGEPIQSNGSPQEPQCFRTVTWGELRQRVAVLTSALRKKGLRSGDRVAHLSANTSDPIVTFLACLSIGVVFSALPTDAGPLAIQGRLSQIRPRLLFTDDIAYYNGRCINVIDRVAKVVDDLEGEGKTDKSLQVVCLVNRRMKRDHILRWKGERIDCATFDDFLSSVQLSSQDNPKLVFEPLPFNHPALIVFSSGTTGEPKSICHSAGGILINSKKEGLLQYDLTNADTFLQVTTCGWIMWLLQVGQLVSGVSIVTYDGSPLYPDAFTIPHIISNSNGKVTGFGGSPRLLSEMEQASKRLELVSLRDRYPMPQLRIATSTGSPLNPANVRFFYRSLAPPHTHLMSISGGTDLAGCLVGGAVTVPVKGHLIGAKCLAMDIRILDPLTGEDCEVSGAAGELTVAKPFPTQPLYFWGDPKDRNALHEKYMDSYYRRYLDGPAQGYWAQGDFISRHPISKQFEIHGRSDGVLNRSGIRYGSAEIYSVIEAGKFGYVADSIVVGQRRPGRDEDERILLFVKCRPGQGHLDDSRKKEIADALKNAYSSRHVPDHIFEVKDIPVTANGKKTELAVKAIVSGNTAFKPSTSTANPESLDEYRQYAEIEKIIPASRFARL